MAGVPESEQLFKPARQLFYRVMAERPDYILPILNPAWVSSDAEQWFYQGVMNGTIPVRLTNGELALEEIAEGKRVPMKGVAPVMIYMDTNYSPIYHSP